MSEMRSEHGFTLVEVLVVIVITGILAAIGLASFLGQRADAQDTEAKTLAAMVATTMVMYEQDAGTFATASRNALIALEPAIAEARNLVVSGTTDTFEISVDSVAGANGGGPFRVEYDAGRMTRECDAAGRGACPRSGRW
jgi:prepilin-type N-terminal cleavage/methylation domain-containing protein